MAAGYTATTEAVEAVVAATAETLIQLRGSTTTNAQIRGWWVSCAGAVATLVPVRVRLLRQTTDGTGSAATEVKLDPNSVAATCTAFHSFTAEPTAGEVIEDVYVPQYNGLYRVEYPDNVLDSPMLLAAATSRIGIEITSPDNLNVLAGISWRE
jgi:hypothetical protein